MALAECPECESKVSDTAMNCPTCGVQLRVAKRGFFGKIFKWGFIAFNILMVIWLLSYWGTVGDMSAANEAEEAGQAVGAAIGTSMLLGIWVVGDIILGLFVLFTRPKQS
jgi:hypothetical protein